jgi:hypothetical protein
LPQPFTVSDSHVMHSSDFGCPAQESEHTIEQTSTHTHIM